MSNNALKTPQNLSLNRFAEQKVKDQIQLTGKALPCSVVAVKSSGIVTVKFEVNSAPWTLPQVTVPVLASRYIRYPVQVGDLGMVFAADARLGGVTGLGGGVAALDQPGNLSALVFAWLGSSKWSATPDAQAVVIMGPNGVILQDDNATHKVTVSSSLINADDNLKIDGDKIGFYGTSPISKETITGALSAVTDANAKAVLTSIIQKLSDIGLFTNGTS